MNDISTFSLMLAVSALVKEAHYAERKIAKATNDLSEDELSELSEHVLDLQRALSEVGGLYSKQQKNDKLQPTINELVEQTIASL
jgi:hypothetical protein